MQHAGEAIKDAREAQALSQTELARQVGIHKSTISRWESGTREPSRVIQTAVKQRLSLNLGVDEQEQQ